ncbi:response regulator [Leptolyngbya sp. BL0902]|uniref:hypothetical protein n=1 Tax=Leptolyngbya sp. BL0902 TaxID=1115757 RepID=UPI0018E73BB2|nr:hypothetical protein [Leptolyngbya sp. BL0902]QQE65107.1 response regulator [Leptolyngbya sp. BL0902]
MPPPTPTAPTGDGTQPASYVVVLSSLPRNTELLVEFIQRQGYPAQGATDLDDLDGLLDDGAAVSLALLDIAGLNAGLWSRCERLQALGIPFLIISPRQSVVVERESMAHGARGTLTKPLVMRELAALINALLKD